MTETGTGLKQSMYPIHMNTETPVVSNARIAVIAASDELNCVLSGIRFARANPTEVTLAEVETLIARCSTLTARIAKLTAAYDKAVRISESR